VWNVLPVISLALGILRWRLKFWEVCARRVVSHNSWRKKNPSWEADSRSTGQEIPSSVSQNLTLDGILNHTHRLDAFIPYFHKILFPFMSRSCRCSLFSYFPTASIAASWQELCTELEVREFLYMTMIGKESSVPHCTSLTYGTVEYKDNFSQKMNSWLNKMYLSPSCTQHFMCISYFFGRIEDVMCILKFWQRCWWRFKSSGRAFLSSVLQFPTFRQIIVLPSSGLGSITPNGGSTLVTLPRIVTPYRDSLDGTRDRVTYQKLVTR
jgi:hypothetical protein